MQRRCVITGVTGQDGHYLADHLLRQGDRVFGVVRRTARCSTDHGVPPGVSVIEGDVRDPGLVTRIADLKPQEIYNLAGFSHVGKSFAQPREAWDINAAGALNMLEAARVSGARFYQASTSEIFGNARAPQSESTPLNPQSPYAVAKAAAHRMVRVYREAYGVFACAGILFNHESPLRGEDFVTQKVVQAAAAAKRAGQFSWSLPLGDTFPQRDWGHARDYVRGMVLMLRHTSPDDYVLATGKSYSVKHLIETVCQYAEIAPPTIERLNVLRRPCEVIHLQGDPRKAEQVLGWRARTDFYQLIQEMCHAAGLPARFANVG